MTDPSEILAQWSLEQNKGSEWFLAVYVVYVSWINLKYWTLDIKQQLSNQNSWFISTLDTNKYDMNFKVKGIWHIVCKVYIQK